MLHRSIYVRRGVCEIRPGDIPEIIELLKKCNLYYPEDDNPENLARKLAKDKDLMLVNVRGHEIVGFAMASYDGWAAIVWHLAVLPAYRNLGIASELMLAIGSRLQNRGAKMVYGFIETKNKRMLQISARMGFNFGPKVFSIGKELAELSKSHEQRVAERTKK